MLKAILPILFLLLCQTSQAQKIRFTDSTNEWTYLSDIPRVYKYAEDTLINTLQYRKLLRPPLVALWIREDTTLQKVFYVYENDTFENLLYDYAVPVGDTLGYWDGCPLVIRNVDTVIVAGQPQIRQNISGHSIIEGIGALDKLFIPGCDKSGTLVCFKNKGNIISVTHPTDGNILSPSTCLLSVKDETLQLATLSPNPIDETSTLQFKTAVTGTFTITNAIGQVLHTEILQQATKIPVGHRVSAPGVYYYRVSGRDGTATGKFVKR